MGASCWHTKHSGKSVTSTLLLLLMMSLPSCTHASRADDVIKQRFHLYKANITCAARIATATLPTDGGSYCEPVWDNVMCWPHYARAGENVTQPCPSYIHGFNPFEKAVRFCTEDGTWGTHPSDEINSSWTDFRNCVKEPDFTVPAVIEKHMPIVIQISTIGYALSLGTLLVATTIMVFFRKLHCQRNTIHINLFISFMLRSIVSLLRNTLLVRHFALPSDIRFTEYGALVFIPDGTHWECKLLNTLWQYSLNANYMWIFVEGLYLHTLIFFAIFSQSAKFFKLYIIIGWVFPLIFILFWVIARIFKNNTLCWNTHDKNYYWILNAPIISSISVNFFFFLNIIRVLFTKIRDCNTRDPRRYRKLAKSTLVLIPLFGVYYIVFILLSLHHEPRFSVVHMYMEMTLNSFQGTVVALLFCFLNGELGSGDPYRQYQVRSEIQKKWHRHWLRRQSIVSARSSRAFSTVSFYTGKERASLTQGLPLCDVACSKDNAVASTCYSAGTWHVFHKVSSMPKLSLGSCTSIKPIPRTSSSTKVTPTCLQDVKVPTLNRSFPFVEGQVQKSDNETLSNAVLVDSLEKKPEHIPFEILYKSSTEHEGLVASPEREGLVASPQHEPEHMQSDIMTSSSTENCQNTDFPMSSSCARYQEKDTQCFKLTEIINMADPDAPRCPV